MDRKEFIEHVDQFALEPLDRDAIKHKAALINFYDKTKRERDQYKTGLETVKTHLETITGRIVKMSGTYQIVCKFLGKC